MFKDILNPIPPKARKPLLIGGIVLGIVIVILLIT
jgi:hypothetical protein